MSKKEVADPHQLPASSGGRRLTLDPIRVIPITLNIREVESTIPCGFQTPWGEVDIDGHLLEVFGGAGFGSGWATIQYKGKSYCFPITEIVQEFLAGLEEAG